MKRLIVFSLLVLMLSVQYASADFLEDTMKYGIGARPLGMGGAFTAISDDVNAIYYNPAGLNSQIFGFSFGNLDVNNNIYKSNNYNLLNIGFMGVSDWKTESPAGESLDMTSVGFGQFGPSGFNWGFSLKNIHYKDLSGSGSTWSSDIGLLLKVTPDISLGFLAQDAIKDKDLNVPSTARFGAAYRPFSRALTLAFDVETGRTGDQGTLVMYGGEFAPSDGFKLRAGSNRGSGTFGLTMAFPFFEINYAYLSNNSSATGSLQTFSVDIAARKEVTRPFSVVRPKEFVLIDVSGALAGGRGEFSIFGGVRTGTDGIIGQIRKARRDSSVDGIILRISGFDGGLGSIGIVQELRAELKKFKASGKKVVVYVENSAIGDEYYLASVADKVVAPFGAPIGGIGRSLVITRISGLMDKIGIDWQVITKGKYKNTFDMFSKEMSKEQRQMISGLVSDMYRQMVDDIASDRLIEVSKIKGIGDGTIYTASQAKEIGLVDNIGYFKDALDVAKEISSGTGDVRVIKPQELYVNEDDYLFNLPSKIAVIEVDGEIVTGTSGSNIIFGGSFIGGDSVSEQIKRASDDFLVRAIILRVNSPGGSPIASGQIYQEIVKAREKGKIVVASLGDVAASGGYFVAVGSDKIVADPGSIVGSIGVIQKIPDISGLYKKLGIKADVIKEGEHSDIFSGVRKLTTDEVRSMENLMEEVYAEFKAVVAKGRGLTSEEVERAAQGKIYTGSQALDIKLVDKLGGFTDAVDYAMDLAKISGEPKLVYYRQDGFKLNNLLELSERLGLKDGLFGTKGSNLSEFRLSY